MRCDNPLKSTGWLKWIQFSAANDSLISDFQRSILDPFSRLIRTRIEIRCYAVPHAYLFRRYSKQCGLLSITEDRNDINRILKRGEGSCIFRWAAEERERGLATVSAWDSGRGFRTRGKSVSFFSFLNKVFFFFNPNFPKSDLSFYHFPPFSLFRVYVCLYL